MVDDETPGPAKAIPVEDMDISSPDGASDVEGQLERPPPEEPSVGPKKRASSMFDVDGDGDVDCWDFFLGVYVSASVTIGAIDQYLMGFPYISPPVAVVAWVALSFQISGMEQLLGGIQNLADTVGSDMSVGDSLPTLMYSSIAGVVLLNLAVVAHGILTWCQRIQRKEAKKAGTCCGLRTRTSRAPKTRCLCLARCAYGCASSGFHFALVLVVTPLLWILLIVELLLACLGSALLVLFFAASKSCDAMVVSAEEKLQSSTFTNLQGAADQSAAAEAQAAQQAEQASQLGSMFGSVDSVTGSAGMSEGITDFLTEGEDFVDRLKEVRRHSGISPQDTKRDAQNFLLSI